MFEKALQTVLKHEGYYANVSGDTGGETYRGISRRYHPTWPGWKIVDYEKSLKGGNLPHNHRIFNVVLDNMIADFYRRYFWEKIQLDQVRDNSLQEIIFDAYVNSGGNAIKLLQDTLNTNFGKSLMVDGAAGPMTIAAINSVNAEQLFNYYKKARERYYYQIAQSGQNLKFLPGWLKRIGAFNYSAVVLPIGLIIGVAGLFFFDTISK
jgi:lysozyme family protein